MRISDWSSDVCSSDLLAIAERLDTLAGGFAAGLKPTGNKDPFALRRNALGLARTIIESGFELDLKRLIRDARIEINIAVAGEVAEKKERAAETAREKGVDISLNQEGSSEFTNRDLAEI